MGKRKKAHQVPKSCSKEYFEHLIVDPDRNNGLRLVESIALAESSEYRQQATRQYHKPLIQHSGVRGRWLDLWELEPSLVYIASPRTARALKKKKDSKLSKLPVRA